VVRGAVKVWRRLGSRREVIVGWEEVEGFGRKQRRKIEADFFLSPPTVLPWIGAPRYTQMQLFYASNTAKDVEAKATDAIPVKMTAKKQGRATGVGGSGKRSGWGSRVALTSFAALQPLLKTHRNDKGSVFIQIPSVFPYFCSLFLVSLLQHAQTPPAPMAALQPGFPVLAAPQHTSPAPSSASEQTPPSRRPSATASEHTLADSRDQFDLEKGKGEKIAEREEDQSVQEDVGELPQKEKVASTSTPPVDGESPFVPSLRRALLDILD
jgi:hypothetical protein